MNIGMLWFDNDPKTTLAMKIQKAVDYYREKYGKTPTLCFVSPSMMPVDKFPGLEIRGNRSVLPNHIWIGVEQ